MVKGKSYMLKIDLDENFRKWCRLKKDIEWACELFGVKPVRFRRRRSFGGWHVIVELDKPLEYAYIFALQFYAGSDRNREIYNFSRLYQGVYANLLFTSREYGEWIDF
jgi:hypothetical protein